MRIRRACLALVLVCLLAMALPAPMHAYDANGNMTARGTTRTIEWDAENRPVSVKEGGNAVASFVYDGFGDRVMKTAGGQTTVYVNDACEKNLATGAETLHYYLGGLYIGYKKGGTLKYVHTDHLGSTSLVTNTSGATVSEIRYYPFGQTRSITPAGSLDTDIRFTGQRYDSETGLYYYRARYYDPDLGRFLSPDSIVQDPANPQAWNPYSYVLNNPLKYTDPSGNFFWIPILVGMAVSGAMYGGEVLLTERDWNTADFIIQTAIGGAFGGIGAEITVASRLAMVGKPLGQGLFGGFTGGGVGTLEGAMMRAMGISDDAIGLTGQARGALGRGGSRVTVDGVDVIQDTRLIAPNLVDARGRTNLARMQKGLAPIGPDGQSINLHHVDQTMTGPVQEMTAIFHQKNYAALHTNTGQGSSQIDRTAFDAWREGYWKIRAGDF